MKIELKGGYAVQFVEGGGVKNIDELIGAIVGEASQINAKSEELLPGMGEEIGYVVRQLGDSEAKLLLEIALQRLVKHALINGAFLNKVGELKSMIEGNI